MTEDWRPVPGNPAYVASSDGRLVSHKGRVPRELAGSLHPDGYLRVHIRGISALKHVHIAAAFHGPRPMGMDVRHLNGNRTDNRPANLAYGTRSDNLHDAVRHGTHHSAAKKRCPQRHPYDAENTYTPPSRSGSRTCRACRAARR